MTTHPNETPEPLAGATIKDSLKVAEPLAQGQAGEMPEPAVRAVYATAQNTPSVKHGFEMSGYLKSPDFYTAAQMREYRTAALQAKDAEIARLKADAGRLIDAGLMLSNFAFNAAQREGRTLTADDCASLKLMYERWDAAIRAQTGGEHG